MAKLIAKTYGEALFELAVEEGKEDVFLEEITAIRTVLKENPEFTALMNHPKITKEEKTEVMENIFRGRISDELTGFFSIIIAKDRYKEIDSILTYFEDQVKALKGIGVAYVTTAVPLRDEQKKKVEEKLLATAGYQKMEMHYIENPKIVGGMVIRICDRVVDSSVSSKLDKLSRQLMKIQLA